MSRFGGFLGGSGLPDPSNFNSAAPGIYSLDEAEAFRRLGYWPLKETRDPYFAVTQFILSADGQLKDTSANAATLTTVGFTRQKVDGPAGKPISAAYNSAGNAYIRPADSANLIIGTGDYTLECWVWPTGQGNNDQPLFDTRNTSNGQGGTYFGFRNSDGAVLADGAYSFGTGSVQVRQWNHVSFVRENGQLRVYVNGVQQGSAVVSTLNHTSGTLVVGGYSYSPVGVNPLIGYIADARATIGAPRYSTTYTPDTAPAPIVQELIPPYAPTLGDAFYGNQSVALNWRNAFNGGSDLTDFDIEYSTASDMSGGTIVNVPVGGAGPYGFSSPTTFTKPDNDTTADVLIPGVLEITRTNQYAIYNSAVQSAWPNSNKPQNPANTEWALGWSSECDVATKTFGNFTDLWGGGGVGSNIVNAELVMRHVPTGRIWFIKFSSWTSMAGGGGFVYERREFYGCLNLPTAHTVTGLTNDTPYYFRVRANNAVGNGAYSSIAGPITPSSILPQRLIGGSPGPSAGPDPYEYDVSLLLHFDGADASTTFTDANVPAKTATLAGTPTISTTQSKYGGASGSFLNNGDYLSFASSQDFLFASNDFTIEAWIYPIAPATDPFGMERGIVGIWSGVTPSAQSWLLYLQGGSLKFIAEIITGDNVVFDVPNVITQEQWYHVAVVRNGTQMYLYVDGVRVSTYTCGTSNITDGTNTLGVGGYNRGNSTSATFNGYIDDLRITKGVARYNTANFSVPTAAFPDPTAPPAYIGTSFKQDNYSESTALANKIFDNSLSNNTTNQWRTNTLSRSFGVDFGTTQEILRYRMWRNTGNEGTPTHWILQGSNTESDWTTLQNNEGQSTYGSWVNIDTRTGVNLPKVTGASPANQPYGEFVVANPGSYRYYRLFVSNARADGPGTTTNRIFLAEMQFLAVITAPATPTGLAATPTSDGANLAWAYAGMRDDFDVEWADDAAFTNILGTTSTTTLVATITGLTIGTTYYVRVRANNSAGTSAYTAGVSFTPAAGYSPNSDNIFRFRLDDQSTAAFAYIWTTTGYAKLVSSTGETSAVAGTGLSNYGNGYWRAYNIVPSITGLATGTERMISVISCDASGTPSGDIEFIDFSYAPPSGGVQRINLLDMSGCTALKGCLANSSTSGVGTYNMYMGSPQPTSLPSTIVEVRAVGIGNALINSFTQTNYPQYMGGISYYHSAGLGVAGQQLSAAALNQLYTDLVQRTSGSGSILVHNNPGTAADDPTIATGKGYTVYGS